jgi:death-on-curing protein
VAGDSSDVEPLYLEAADALGLYALIIGATTVQAEDHLRNRPGLESALSRPRAYAHYQDADLALQAAVLAHGLAEGQHFIDGNKRLALVSMLAFLELNGYLLEAADPDLAAWIIGLSGAGTPDQLAEVLRTRLRPAS